MHDLSTLIETFVDPITLILALIFAASVMRRKRLPKYRYELVVGGLFAAAVVYTMSSPIPIYDGGIFDMRFLLIGTCTALMGPLAGAIAASTGMTYRIVIGGAGVGAGVGGIMIVFAAALVWRRYLRDAKVKDWQNAVLLGAIMTLHSLSIFLAPQPLWASLFMTLLPYMLVTNVAGALLIKHLLHDELRFFDQAEGLRKVALIDHLTGLENRRSLEQRFDDMNQNRKLSGAGISVLFFDIDRFKRINDCHGHEVGDAVLTEVAGRLTPIMRQDDIFARISGDEFIVVLRNIDPSAAEQIAERCRRAVADKAFRAQSDEISVTISVGGVWRAQPAHLKEVMNDADRALYAAKSKGRNVVMFGSPDAFGTPRRKVEVPQVAA